MIRAKQLGSLSQSARSLLISGSRCSATDGSSCTCSEDEAHISERSLRGNAQNLKASPSLLSKASVRVGLLSSIDSEKSETSKKSDCFSQLQNTTVQDSSDRVCSVGYSNDSKDSVYSSSPCIADQFMKAGMATVGILSELVNYRIPLTEGSASKSVSATAAVGHTRPVSIVAAVATSSTRKDKIAVKPTSVSASESTHEIGDGAQDASYCVSTRPSDNKNSTFQKPEGKLRGNRGEHFNGSVRKVRALSGASNGGREFPFASAVSEKVSLILHEEKWGPAAEIALSKLNCSLDAYQANQILKQVQDHTVALNFFYWLKQQPGFKHDGHTYTTMIGILGRAKQFESINRLLNQMVSEGCMPNVVTYNRLIHSYGRANFLSEAIGVFDQMQKFGCRPDRVTYCTLIDIHAKAGYLDVAIDMYQRMQEAGLSPDTFTYSVIINCLGKAGHLPIAHKLFCEMVNQGCVPNLVTYNIMIALHAKARNYQTSLQLYRDMQSAGFEPDKVTYSIVMEVLGHCGYLEEAEGVFVEMKRKNWVPDEPVYGLLVDLWGKAGNVEKAWSWYNAMLDAGLCPNVPSCNSLLGAFLRVHRLPDAYNLLQSMLNLGLKPSLQTYTLLLSCCTETQSMAEKSFCCELMATTNHPAHSFLLSMPSPSLNGQNVRNHVSNFLNMMHSEDRESKRGLVDAVIDFFHKTGLKEEAGSVWEVAAQRNVYPDAVRQKSSCYWLINLHVMSDGTAVTALSRTLAGFRREILESGICPGRIDIITGWGRRSRVTGTSLVRQAVEQLLKIFKFPFCTENGNSGCFVGCGEALCEWLMHSCVERMHLL